MAKPSCVPTSNMGIPLPEYLGGKAVFLLPDICSGAFSSSQCGSVLLGIIDAEACFYLQTAVSLESFTAQ